ITTLETATLRPATVMAPAPQDSPAPSPRAVAKKGSIRRLPLPMPRPRRPPNAQSPNVQPNLQRKPRPPGRRQARLAIAPRLLETRFNRFILVSYSDSGGHSIRAWNFLLSLAHAVLSLSDPLKFLGSPSPQVFH